MFDDRVLVVDDNESNLNMLHYLLSHKGIKSDVANSGKMAIELSEKKDYSLFLLDIEMPGMDGYELAQKFKSVKKTQNVPIIFLSANPLDHSNILKGFESGAVDYLTKPVHEELLLAKIKTFKTLYDQHKQLVRLNHSMEELLILKDSEIEETSRKLYEVIRHLKDIIYSRNVDENLEITSFTYVSQQVLHILGYTVDEIIHNPRIWDSIIHREDREKARIDKKELVTPEAHVRRYRMKYKNRNKYLWIEDSITPTKDSTGRVVAINGVARDITSRVEQQAVIAQQEKNFAQLFENASEGILLVKKHNGHILNFNKMILEHLRYLDTDMVRLKVLDLFPDQYSSEFDKWIKGITSEDTFIREFVMKQKKGVHIPVEISARMVNYGTGKVAQMFVRDISERKKQEKEKRKQEEQFRNISENAPVIIYEVDKKGKILFSNQKDSKSTPDNKTKLFGPLKASERKVLNSAIGKALNEGLTTSFSIHIQSGKNVKYFEGKVAPLREPLIDQAVIIAQDVTTKVLAERKTLELVEDLKALDVLNSASIKEIPFQRFIEILVNQYLELFKPTNIRVYLMDEDLDNLELSYQFMSPALEKNTLKKIGVNTNATIPKLTSTCIFDVLLKNKKQVFFNQPDDVIKIINANNKDSQLIKLSNWILNVVHVGSFGFIAIKSGSHKIGLISVTFGGKVEKTLIERIRRFSDQAGVLIGKYNTQKEMKKHRDFNQSLLNNLPSEVTVKDAQQNYIYLNKTSLSNDKQREWMIGKKDEAYFSKYNERNQGLLKKRNVYFQNALEGKKSESWEEYEVQKDDTVKYMYRQVVPHIEDGKFKYMIAYGTDISSIKKAERDVLVMQRAIESAKQGIFITDPQKSHNPIIYINKAFEQLTGFTKEEILGHEAGMLKGKLTNRVTLEDIRHAIEKEIPFQGRVLIYRKDGKTFWTQLSLTPVKDNNDKLINFIYIISDITSQINAQKKLTESVLEGQEKERRRIAQDLHDGLGQLLSSATMYLQVLAHKTQEPMVATIEDIVNGSIKEYRAVSHNLISPLLHELGLIEAVNSTCKRINDSEQIKITFKSNVKKLGFSENIDAELFRMVQELINNSLKYAKAKNLKVSINKSDDFIVIIVEDNGEGFDADKVARGTKGIGLSNIKARAELLEAIAEIESVPGKGTKTTISLPNHLENEF